MNFKIWDSLFDKIMKYEDVGTYQKLEYIYKVRVKNDRIIFEISVLLFYKQSNPKRKKLI